MCGCIEGELWNLSSRRPQTTIKCELLFFRVWCVAEVGEVKAYAPRGSVVLLIELLGAAFLHGTHDLVHKVRTWPTTAWARGTSCR